ncbi:TolC family protein [Flavobacterium sp. ARAG 55.4]|uniref:TolC family protein n=1 Tax=Flavobacterium sp. ARAG 55.4 TaxID=3451357 RepID=UPI003F46DFAA
MKQLILPTIFLFSVLASAQNIVNDTIFLSRKNAETIFLQNNLSLISERLNIDIAQAQIIQAKVWPNPTFSVNEFNLWRNTGSEELPAIWGDYGRYQEFGASLEQLVYTAGKRKKMIAIEKVGAEMAVEYYKNFLRNLKMEFRNNLTAMQYNQAKKIVYLKQLQSVQNLTKSYAIQMELGNISPGDYIRLKASEVEFLNELNTIEIENNALQSEMKKLLHLNPMSYVKISEDDAIPDMDNINNLNIENSIAQIENYRPDVKLAKLNEKYSQNKYVYEKALKTPDITLEASYDRGGNIMQNFFGLGFSIDLPVFDRNQGNIKAAQFSVEQSKLNKEEVLNNAQTEIMEAYNNFKAVQSLYENIGDDYQTKLDKMLDNYLMSFKNRNISLLVYLDYVEAYLNNKMILLDTQKELNNRLEEFKNASGQELN